MKGARGQQPLFHNAKLKGPTRPLKFVWAVLSGGNISLPIQFSLFVATWNHCWRSRRVRVLGNIEPVDSVTGQWLKIEENWLFSFSSRSPKNRCSCAVFQKKETLKGAKPRFFDCVFFSAEIIWYETCLRLTGTKSFALSASSTTFTAEGFPLNILLAGEKITQCENIFTHTAKREGKKPV